jgi:hypothetical protein
MRATRPSLSHGEASARRYSAPAVSYRSIGPAKQPPPPVAPRCATAARPDGVILSRQGAAMRRRKFLTLLGSAAVACPLAAGAQQTRKLPTVALILVSASAITDAWSAAFTERLHELGWTDGRTVAIEYHGRRDVLSASPRSRPSSCSKRSMSLSRMGPPSPH